jgi:hypothetical protein
MPLPRPVEFRNTAVVAVQISRSVAANLIVRIMRFLDHAVFVAATRVRHLNGRDELLMVCSPHPI